MSSILTDQERINLMQATGVNTGSYEIAIARAIERAVIAKLATVSVELDLTPLWFLINAWQETKPPAFDLVGKINGEVLRLVSEALAAARAQALEEAAKRMEGPNNNYGAVIRALIGCKDD